MSQQEPHAFMACLWICCQVFEALGGNTVCNSIWEAQLDGQTPAASQPAAVSSSAAAAGSGASRRQIAHSDSWIWDDHDDVADEMSSRGVLQLSQVDGCADQSTTQCCMH